MPVTIDGTTGISGPASGLTDLNASNLSTGTVPDARFPATLPAVSGANLTALNASNLGSGTVPDARFPATLPAASGANLTALNASNLGSGTVPDARFPATLPAASGANLTALNASNLSSGTVATARLGSGTANSGTFLRGDGTWQAVSTTPSTAQVLSAYAGASYGAVGTYFLTINRAGGATTSLNTNYAGSDLWWRDTTGNDTGAGLSGTWRFLGGNGLTGQGLYLRIS